MVHAVGSRPSRRSAKRDTRSNKAASQLLRIQAAGSSSSAPIYRENGIAHPL
jgi:hypothetical protein